MNFSNMNSNMFSNTSSNNNNNNNNIINNNHHHHHHQYLAGTGLPLVQEQQPQQQQQQYQQQQQQPQQPQTLQQLCDRIQSLERQQTCLAQVVEQLRQQLQLPLPQPLVGTSLPSTGPASASSAPSPGGQPCKKTWTTPNGEGLVMCECGNTYMEKSLKSHRKRGCRLREKEEKPQCRYCLKRFGALDYVNGVHKRYCRVRKAQREQQRQAAAEASSGTGSSSGSPPGFFASPAQLVSGDGLLPFWMNSQQAGAAPETLAATLAPQQEQQKQQQQQQNLWGQQPQPQQQGWLEQLQYTGSLDIDLSNLNTNYMADLTNGMGPDMNFAPFAFPEPSNAVELPTDSQFTINPELLGLAQSPEATAAAVLPAAQPADLDPAGPTDEVDQVQTQSHDDSGVDESQFDYLFNDPSPSPTPTAPQRLWLPQVSISQTQA
ncbi:hypothetical protein V8F33_004761 [Rhypophila sp. PSN 637]